MKIAVNTRFLLKDRLEGMGWFTHETLKRIVLQHPEHEFIFLFDRAYDESFIYAKNVRPIIIQPPARHPFLWYLWFEWAVPKILKKEKPDLFLSPDGYASLSTNIPITLVIHDLAFEHYPKHINQLARKYYQYYTPKFAHKAQRIATVSQYSKQDISQQYNIPSDKIDVVYNGCNESYQPISKETQQATKIQYANNCDYFLYIGAMHPRKNVSNLFKAFENFKKQTNSPVKLVMIGRKAWGTDKMEQVYNQMTFQKDVIFTGRVSEQVLKKILGSALALTYVPYFEGFGIPIIEAQYMKTPVITSDLTSMPEVAGKGAILIDPFNVETITKAMIKMAKDKSYRQELITAGTKNCQKYTWQKSADALWNTMLKTLV
ncbi:MAG: glycosyltransferase involved in cell wall biosynthesis [Maribacter sp.]|jgi:glycosyltransferase involved in cell wall biosynthesis